MTVDVCLRVCTEAFLERHRIATDRRSQYAKCSLYISCLSIKRKGCPGSPPKLLKYFYGAMNQKTISCTPSQKCQRVLKVSHSGAVMHGMGKGRRISSHLHPPGTTTRSNVASPQCLLPPLPGSGCTRAPDGEHGAQASIKKGPRRGSHDSLMISGASTGGS